MGVGVFCVCIVRCKILLDILGENKKKDILGESTPGRKEARSHGSWIIFNTVTLRVQTET